MKIALLFSFLVLSFVCTDAAEDYVGSSAIAAIENLMTYRCPTFTFCIRCPDGQKTTCAFPPSPFQDPEAAIQSACRNHKQLDCMSSISYETYKKLGKEKSLSRMRPSIGERRAMATLRKLYPGSTGVVSLTIVQRGGGGPATVRLSGVESGIEYGVEVGPHTACRAAEEKHDSKKLVKSLISGDQDMQVELTVTSLAQLRGQPVTLMEYGKEGEEVAPLPYACGRFIVV